MAKSRRFSVSERYERSPKRRIANFRKFAKRRKLAVKLTDEYLQAVITHNGCIYCEGPLPETVIGLDRLNSDKGYVPDNVVPCCTNCNALRGNLLTFNEMQDIMTYLKHVRKTKRPWENSQAFNKQRRKRR